ncbi:MAG: hypothetical protein JWQ19_1516 [Subtercola sp.]|nr:hypothetical protein [Subtercola sp.]
MSNRTHAAMAIWRARTIRTAGDRSFLVYMVFMVALVAIAPVGRAVWLSAVSPGGLAVLASPAAPNIAALIVAVLWACALLLGRDRGAVIRPPFLTHALATSDRPRTEAFRGPLLRSGGLVTAACTITAGFVGASLAQHALTDLLGVISFMSVGAFVGVIATVLWLAGQVFPRPAISVAVALLAFGALTAAVPGLQAFTPWGWAGLAYPSNSNPPAPVALTGLTVAVVAATPWLMSRLRLNAMTVQAARWHSATTHATGMDFGAAATIYQGRPHIRRRTRAVRLRGQLAWIFFIRDAIGATRTPGRLIVGVLALIAGGVILAFAFAPAAPGWLLGAAAGLAVFVGLGPVSDGIRHAAVVSADFPLYGISDEQLMLRHAIFPLIVTVIVLLAATVVCSLIIGTSPGAAIAGALSLGLLGLVVRIVNALKGPLPPILLTPIPTAMGDPMAAVRMAWALDGLLLAALVGTSAALAVGAPLLLLTAAGIVIGSGIFRWRSRR